MNWEDFSEGKGCVKLINAVDMIADMTIEVKQSTSKFMIYETNFQKYFFNTIRC